MLKMAKSNDLFSERPKPGQPWDCVIVGSGPAAFTAAIYTTRGAASTLIVGGDNWGGQLMLTTTVDNFPGTPSVQGPELMQRMKDHALSFGAEFLAKNVTDVDFSKAPFKVHVGDEVYLARSVIIATGADTKWLGVPGEEKLRGRGVSSCAPCDAPFFKGKDVVVVGGGDAAMEEALVLTKYAKNVTIIHRGSKFKASAAMQKRVFDAQKENKIKVIYNSEILEFIGDRKLEKIKVKDNLSGKVSDMVIDGVFISIGHLPATEAFVGKVHLDEKGYIRKNMEEYHTATNINGVFTAGDVHDFHYKQAITAAGFGCMAAMDALTYLDKDTSVGN